MNNKWTRIHQFSIRVSLFCIFVAELKERKTEALLLKNIAHMVDLENMPWKLNPPWCKCKKETTTSSFKSDNPAKTSTINETDAMNVNNNRQTMKTATAIHFENDNEAIFEIRNHFNLLRSPKTALNESFTSCSASPP